MSGYPKFVYGLSGAKIVQNFDEHDALEGGAGAWYESPVDVPKPSETEDPEVSEGEEVDAEQSEETPEAPEAPKKVKKPRTSKKVVAAGE